MSKILQQETQFTDIDIVRQALEQQGFSPVYDENYAERVMQGYAGQTFKANLGVTRANFLAVTKIGTYGDLGFRSNSDGSVGFTGDDLLINKPQFTEIMSGITGAYAEKKYTKELNQSGFSLSTRNVLANGEVELNFVPMAGY